MGPKIKKIFSYLYSQYRGLSSREQKIVSFVGITGIILLIYQTIVSLNQLNNSLDIAVKRRQNDVLQTNILAREYLSLTNHRELLTKKFAEVESNFQQVNLRVAKIVKGAISSDNYDFTTNNTTSDLGLGFKTKDYSLAIKSITVEQLTKVIFELEQGERPLFIKKVFISSTSKDLSAKFDLYSIERTKGEQVS